MPVERTLPTQDARDLIELTREVAAGELAPRAAEYEAEHRFPREVFRTLGQAGLLSLPYPETYGGGAQPYEVYLQVLEELAMAWGTVALGVGVHTLSCHPLYAFGTEEQRKRWLPEMLGGESLGAYCLSEPHSGSDAAALRTAAVRDGDDYVLDGTKSWVSHGGVADFYIVFCRTGADKTRGISTMYVPAGTAGLLPQQPERKMGLTASPTTQIVFDGARVPADHLIGEEGIGFKIAMDALDGGRLGISACAVGIAQAALEAAVGYARQRRQFGRAIIEFQGLEFMLADMATQVEAARALYLSAARLRDAGRPYSKQASMSKLFCTDTAMRVATDAVQVFGGYGYTADFPVERYLREVKVMQIFEGTNQIQRVVIGKELGREAERGQRGGHG